ncbi:MAG: hypothetical protein K2X66_07870 [Cyanobacteria bacterium]|nr:hypothetical protein [Cyanobacteriota bacterium]
MSNALQILSEAFRQHNLEEVTSFSVNQEFPYNIALNLLNDVIREFNRQGSFWFTETKTNLGFTVGKSSYSLASLGIDVKRIRFLRREDARVPGELQAMNYRGFLNLFRNAPVLTGMPSVYSKFGDTLELNMIPDQDYALSVYHFKNLPFVSDPLDTFLIPERDEDVLIDACFQLLGYRLGRWNLANALQGISIKIRPLLSDMNRDAGVPHQMPAAF